MNYQCLEQLFNHVKISDGLEKKFEVDEICVYDVSSFEWSDLIVKVFCITSEKASFEFVVKPTAAEMPIKLFACPSEALDYAQYAILSHVQTFGLAA